MSRLMEDLPSIPSTASTSQEDHESNSGSTSFRKLRITLLSSEWRSTKGGLSTINRELAIQLAKHPIVEVSVYLPQCSEEDKRAAASHSVTLIEAEEMPGLEPNLWLSCLPKDHAVDCVIGHGAVLGRQVQILKRIHPCKWIQVVHTAPEELGMYKSYADAISKGEKKHQDEVKLCEKADQVVAVGPKLAEAFSGYLRACGKDQDVLNLTPGIFSEFYDVKQATEERKTFSVLVFGRGDNEDFQLKGYDIAALAIAQLKDEPEPYKLLFVGAPSGKEEKVKDLLLQQGIDRSQLTVRCFNESREQLARLFCEVDLAIMPSRTEGFGLAALEALSAGLPVLVSGNSGLGEALQEVPFGPYCVVESEDPKDWANAIRGARKKKRKFRLDESKILCEIYAKVYNWQDHCNRLVEIMCNISRENRASNEQDSSVTATVDCHTGEKPSRSEKLPQKGPSEGLQPVKHGKRPLPPSGIPDPKQPRLSKDKENLDIHIDTVEQGGASPSQNVSGKENVEDRRATSAQELLVRIGDRFIQKIPPSDEKGFNGFLQYMEKVRQAIVVDVKTGSLIITVRCTSLRILDDLWKDYCTGHLQEVAQRYLVTEDILQQLGLDSVQLTLTISEEEYKAYRKNFLKNGGIVEPVENTSLPGDLLSVSNLDTIKTEGEQTLPTDAEPSEFSQDLSPPCKASTSQEGQGNSSSSPFSKELRAVSLKGSKEGKRPLTSTSTLASKSPKTLGDEGSKEGKRPLTSSSTLASKSPKTLADEGRDTLVLVKLLKVEYKRRSQLRPLLWDSTIQLPIEQVYTRLKIVSRGKLAVQMEDDEVNVFDVFKVSDIGEDVMTLVEGSPGIGKTTFCLKLAYDWAHGNIPSECPFPKFKFVFLLKCRDIEGDIMESISEQLLPRDMEKSVDELLHLLKDIHNQEKMLVILDGLDELPEKSQHHVDELLHRRILPFCYVLATTQKRGIEIRKRFLFDIHLEIKGYTESDSIAYVRRHFETIGQSPKGERLIEEMQQNTFLHALRNNPLNLLLLCVIFEDYEGKLPTFRTELYQVIVQCLLRRYCARHGLAVPKDNTTLQKRFEEDVLALGELAWACLLNDRQSFSEGKLAECEVKNQNMVARKIGLLYMEESMKRISPQHEYWFLHKTFQEFLAAAFITRKLQNGELNVFEYTTFDDLVGKYSQVFLFVSGMLGEKATVLFTQIGEKLNENGDWDWSKCSDQASKFFVESFRESGHAEEIAVTLCSIIPFPEEVFLLDKDVYPFARVLIACKRFSNLQFPVKLTAAVLGMDLEEDDVVFHCIECISKLTTVRLELPASFRQGSPNKDRLYNWLSSSKSLSELTLNSLWNDSEDVPLLLCNGLASCQSLTKVKFTLSGKNSGAYFNAVDIGLSADNPLSSAIVLEIYGSMSHTAIQALQKLLTNKSLISLSLHICGDVGDLLVAAVSNALAKQTSLKSIDLRLGGKLSSSGVNILQKGLLENTSLNYFEVVVLGEVPDNWQSVMETIYSTKKSVVTYVFCPNNVGNIAEEPIDLVLAENGLVPKQHLTVSVWGKLSCEEAKALCKVLVSSSLALLTLNVHGNLTDDVIISIASGLKGCKTLSFLFVNIWGNLSLEGRTILSALNNLSVHLNEYATPEESNLLLDVSVDNRSALKSFFAKVKDTSKEKVSLTINNNGDAIKEWAHHLSDALAENTSLTSLDLTLNNCLMDGNLGEDVGECLVQSTSIKTLSLTISCSDIKELIRTLSACFAKRTSFTTLSLEINDYSEEAGLRRTKVTNILAAIKPLSALSVAVHSGSMVPFWERVVSDCLRKCTSLKSLSLVINTGHIYMARDSTYTFRSALAGTTVLNTFSLAAYVNGLLSSNESLLACVDKLSTSLTTLTVTLSLGELVENRRTAYAATKGFETGLSKNKFITTLNLTINEFGEGISHVGSLLRYLRVFEGLALNKSVTTFNLTLSGSREVSDDWLPGLCDALKKNTSLTTLRLKVNNHCSTGKSRLYDLRKLALESKSLSLLEIEVSFYGKESE